MQSDWLFTTEKSICDLRVAAVIIRANKILVQKDKNGCEYALPGGHVKIGETLENALIRELQEELGITVQCGRMLWSEECFWEWNGKQAHNISFYYLVDFSEETEIISDGEFVPQKDNDKVLLGWMPMEKIQEVTIYPEFLKNEVYCLSDSMKHFVSRG